LLNKALETVSITDLSENLNVARGTVKRWLDLNDVPQAYQFDLMKIVGMDIDYSKFSSKEKDQFFTPVETAKYCYDVFQGFLESKQVDEKSITYLEPSAGDGSFIKVLPPERTVGLDVEPKMEGIIQQDYLQFQLDTSKFPNKQFVVFGNPPFGLRGHLALKFINHSYHFADFVCFILPQLFESDGKGSPRKRVEGYNLVHSEKLDTKFYEPSGREMVINVIFQIWSKHYEDQSLSIKDDNLDSVKVFSLSDGGTPSSTRNKQMLNKCDVYLPSTCFGKENMKIYNSFEDLPGRKGYGIVFEENVKKLLTNKIKSVDWSTVGFLSTNSAYNLRSSQIKQAISK
jgi:hypothetical protein